MPTYKVVYHVPFAGDYPGDFLRRGTGSAAAPLDDFATRLLQTFKTTLTSTIPGTLDESTMTFTSDSVPADDGDTITREGGTGWSGVGRRFYRIHVSPLATNEVDTTTLDGIMGVPPKPWTKLDEDRRERAKSSNTGEIKLYPTPTGGRKSRRNRRMSRRKARKARTVRRR